MARAEMASGKSPRGASGSQGVNSTAVLARRDVGRRWCGHSRSETLHGPTPRGVAPSNGGLSTACCVARWLTGGRCDGVAGLHAGVVPPPKARTVAGFRWQGAGGAGSHPCLAMRALRSATDPLRRYSGTRAPLCEPCPQRHLCWPRSHQEATTMLADAGRLNLVSAATT